MKLYVPVRKDRAVWRANLMSCNLTHIEGNSYAIRDVIGFLRRKDAKEWIKEFNSDLKYPIEMDIAVFEHKKKMQRRGSRNLTAI